MFLRMPIVQKITKYISKNNQINSWRRKQTIKWRRTELTQNKVSMEMPTNLLQNVFNEN